MHLAPPNAIIRKECHHWEITLITLVPEVVVQVMDMLLLVREVIANVREMIALPEVISHLEYDSYRGM